MMGLGRLFRKDPWSAPAAALYGQVVAQARLPEFYAEAGVPDSLDGRFELVSLHLFLLLRRLKREGEAGAALGQAVFDAMFADMDTALRELGAGDIGVSHKVKRMVRGFYGRVAAYEAGLEGAQGPAGPAGTEAGPETDVLVEALRRNLLGTVRIGDPGELEAARTAGLLAAYTRAAAGRLATQATPDLLAGRVEFPRPSFA